MSDEKTTEASEARAAVEHELKTWPPFFGAVWSERKMFEVRADDRDFRVGDRLLLREWEPIGSYYTGRYIRCSVSYVMRGGRFGLAPGFVVMSLSDVVGHKEHISPLPNPQPEARDDENE